jgi:extracellular factor (EF) 3-hydroxypalmitic acid methyl ester biosynthesis protein
MVTLLEILPEYVLSWLVKHGMERHLAAEEVLLSEGSKNTSFFMVLDGLLGVSDAQAIGGRIAHITAGGIAGEISMFADEPVASPVVAEEPSLVLEIGKSVLQEKLDHDHVFASDFYRVMLTYTTRLLRENGVRLQAAVQEAKSNGARHPLLARAQEHFDLFKRTMVDLDKEALKNGTITEDRYRQFSIQAGELMNVCHTVLGVDSSLDEVTRRQISSRLQHEMLPYVLTTETAERFYSKPRGYAGDYLAIHKIYANLPSGTGRLGPIVDRMFLDAPPSVAVRNRRSLMANEIVATVNAKPQGTARVLCLASGPATEVFDAFDRLQDRARLSATLMDIDLQALAFVDERRTAQKLSAQINLVNENLIALFLGRRQTKLEPQDLIYSIGLIDYLNDKLVAKLLQYVYGNLAPGGRVILGNFHPSNPAREFMDSVLEWNLIHRTEEDMNRLFKNSPFNQPCSRIQYEGEGIDLFAECVK